MKLSLHPWRMCMETDGRGITSAWRPTSQSTGGLLSRTGELSRLWCLLCRNTSAPRLRLHLPLGMHAAKPTSEVTLPWLPWESQPHPFLRAPLHLVQISVMAPVIWYCEYTTISLLYQTMHSLDLSHRVFPALYTVLLTNSGSWLCAWELKSRKEERNQGEAKCLV